MRSTALRYQTTTATALTLIGITLLAALLLLAYAAH